MSKELDQYLEDQPIFMFKLVDGSTIVGRMQDIDDKDNIVLEDAREVTLHESGKPALDMAMHEYMFLSDERITTINLDKVITYSEVTLSVKRFYSKSLLHHKIKQQEEFASSTITDLFKAFIDGLDNKGYSNKYTGWDGHPKPWPPEEDV
tara:strand:+ start:262 stop:711 length:450 start_codon:yes stop_codon:yes gene_type:complete